MAKARSRQPRCPECRALLPRGAEEGPCPKCDWEEEYEEEYEEEAPRGRRSAGRRAPARRGGSQPMSPVLLGVLVGGGAAALILVLLVAMNSGSSDPAPLQPTTTAGTSGGERDKPVEVKKPEPSPREKWAEEYRLVMARLEKQDRINSSTTKQLEQLRKDGARYGTAEEKGHILDVWIRLDPENEKLRELRGDVLYTGPFRRQVNGRWEWPVHPKTGRKTKIWITREEEAALAGDQLYQDALQAVETVREIDGSQGESKSIHTFFFFDDDVAPRPFLVASQSKTPALAKDRAESTMATLVPLRRSTMAIYDGIINKFAGDREFLVPMYVFGGTDVYEKFRARSTIKGMPSSMSAAGFFSYNPVLKPIGWLFVWAKNPKSRYFQEVITHEGTHLLQWQYGRSNQGAANRRNPGLRSRGSTCWFQEGLAEYWGGFAMREKDGLRVMLPGYDQGGRLNLLGPILPKKGEPIPTRMPVQKAGYMPLRQLCRRSYSDYHAQYSYRAERNPSDLQAQKLVGLFYAQGWAFVHFLMHYKEGKYRKAVLRYMATELDCKFDWRQLERDLGLNGAAGWKRLDAEFIEYVREALLDAPKSRPRPWEDKALTDMVAAIKKREARLAAKRAKK